MADDGATIEFEVNGQPQAVEVAPTTPLMYVLRNDLGFKGVRAGCSIGECGACRVHLDGEAVPSCITPMSEVSGTSVTTPEGLGVPDAPHPVQQAFLDEQAAQCGYCINGMIMSVAARLEQSPAPDAAALRDALDDHLCRCGTQLRILRAAARAAGLEETGAPADVVVERARVEDAQGAPAILEAYPDIADWLGFHDDGTVLVKSGKVELGQGLRAALLQIVASQLGLSITCVQSLPTITGSAPDQGQTSGSFSIEHAGAALAMAARALRRILLERASQVLKVEVATLHLDDEGILAADGRRLTLADLARLGPVTGPIGSDDLPDWHADLVGAPIGREDLRRKLTGAAAYVHDFAPADALHARVVLPPGYDARLGQLDLDAARRLPGVVEVVRDGSLVLVVADREEAAIRAQARMHGMATWEVGEGIAERDTERLLRSLPTREYVRVRDDDVEAALGDDTVRATYVRPYHAHGPMSPSAAVARHDDDGLLRVWTHSQGIYPLRREMATVLGLSEDGLVIEHADGPGCYGMNGADDAALLAAIAARAVPGRAVRFQFSIQDEFACDPYGPGMVGDLAASLNADGRILAWRHHVITDSHSTRPNGDGDRLLAAWLAEGGPRRPWVGLGEPGTRNAKPIYDLPQLDVTGHEVRGPLRTGPLRSLGAFFNVFAAESFMDELAERAGQDPVAFRLAHLRDERAAGVLQVAAERAGWRTRVGPSGRGMGIALSRYKDTKGFAAVVAEVEVDTEHGAFRLVRLLVACDVGTVVNVDGLRNQLEGGVIQGVSRTLYEELHLAEHGVREQDWTTYRSLRFSDVPPVEIVVVDRPGSPPLGAGEITTPPVPAAIANAIDDAIGIRMRRLPLTPERLQQRLLEMSEAEAVRVLL